MTGREALCTVLLHEPSNPHEDFERIWRSACEHQVTVSSLAVGAQWLAGALEECFKTVGMGNLVTSRFGHRNLPQENERRKLEHQGVRLSEV